MVTDTYESARRTVEERLAREIPGLYDSKPPHNHKALLQSGLVRAELRLDAIELRVKRLAKVSDARLTKATAVPATGIVTAEIDIELTREEARRCFQLLKAAWWRMNDALTSNDVMKLEYGDIANFVRARDPAPDRGRAEDESDEPRKKRRPS